MKTEKGKRKKNEKKTIIEKNKKKSKKWKKIKIK